MSVVSPQHPRRALPGLAAALCALALGCTPGRGPERSAVADVSTGPGYSWFGKVSPHDPWTPKILGWQSRERAQPSVDTLVNAPPAVSKGRRPAVPVDGPTLRERYSRYRQETRRETARELAKWMQSVAKRHYVADGLIDHWATLEETLDRNGDDCDGLELLAFHFLLDQGFPPDEVFRAVIYRPEDGQHHMVTLWFEDPHDPWVIDPTGAMTTGMPHMSERPEWVPLELFTESEQFTVRPVGARSADSGRAYPAAARR
jgi:hypothetical protein